MKDLYRSFQATVSDVLSVTNVGTGTRHVANQKSSNDKNKTYTMSSSDKEAIKKALTDGTNVPKTLWKKMSRKDQNAFCGKRRAKHNGAPDKHLSCLSTYLHSITKHITMVRSYKMAKGTATRVIAHVLNPKDEVKHEYY